ncbi:MAG: flippase [Anaerolineales bacterium]|nr:flippase [Anaerolineales bacterium]
MLKLINFVFSVYVVRRLGDGRFGQYSIVLGFVGLFQIFAELGISQYVMREMARDRSKVKSLFWNLVILRFLLAVAGIAGITVAASVVGYTEELILGVFVYTLTFLMSAIESPLETLLTANERLDYIAALQVIGKISFVTIGSIFLFSGLNFVWLIGAGVLGMTPQIIFAIWVVRRFELLPREIEITPAIWPSILRAGVPFGVIALTLSIASSIDTVMLSIFRPDYVVGWYNVAYGLVFSISFLALGFLDAIVPSLSRAYTEDPEAVEQWHFRSIKFTFMFSIPTAVGGMLIAYPLIRFLYTDQFLPSALGLQILIWDIPLVMFANFCGRMTTIVGEERAAARIYTINGIANVLMNLYAIPKFGLIGAAFVTVLTDLISALQFHFLLDRKLHLPDMKLIFVRIGLAAVVMGGVVWMARDVHFILQILIGGGVYVALIFLVGLIDQSEREIIRKIIQKLGSRLSLKKAA